MKKILSGIRQNWIFFMVFVLISAAITGVVALFMHWNTNRVFSEAGEYLSALGTLKSAQISLWKQERILDGQTIQTDRGFSENIFGLVNDKKDLSVITVNQQRLRSLLLDPNYSTIYIYDNQGEKVLVVGDLAFQPAASVLESLEAISRSGETTLSEFYLAADGTARMDMIVPILNSEEPDFQVIGILIFCIPADAVLFPLIQEVPDENQTTETLLVEKRMDDVLFLNNLRFVENAALRLTIPLTRTNVPAVMAAQGQTGIVYGVDYGGEEVMAYLAPISGTNWKLISKRNIQESQQPINQYNVFIVIAAVVLLSSIIITFRVFWRRQTATITRVLSESEVRRKTLEEKYLTLFDQANDAILLIAENGKILEANEKATHLYGYSKAELLSLTIHDIREVTSQAQIVGDMQRVKEKETQYFETVHRKKNGEVFPVDVSSRFIKLEGQGLFQSFIRDASRRKKIEQELRDSSEALKNAQHLANIGSWYWDLRSNDMKWSEEMFVIFGIPPDMPELNMKRILQEFIHPEDRERIEQITRDTLKEHQTFSFDTRIIRLDGVERDHWVEAGEFFYDQNGELIAVSGITQDVTEKKQVEKELRKRENLLQRIFDLLPVGLWITDENGKMTSSNKMIKEIWGKDLLVELDELEVFHGRRLPSMQEIKPDDWASYHTIKEGVTIRDEMIEIDAYDGKTKTILNYSTPILDEKGNLEGSIILNLDISELRETQQQLTAQLDELRRWNLATLGRENRIRELKSEINELRKQLGLPPQYQSGEDVIN